MKGYRYVAVKLAGEKVSCDPDPATLYFRKGPDCVRFTFLDIPPKVASVVIRWKDPKRPLFAGWGTAPSTVGSHHPDIITRGNNQVAGRYEYTVELLDAQGRLLAQVDPGLENQGDPP